MAILSINSSSKLPADNSDIVIDSMNPNDVMILLDKFKVDTWLFESVTSHFNEMLPYLLKDSEYTWQELLGEDFWADLTVPRHLPSLCLKHLAQQPGSQLSVMPLTGCDTTYFQIN